jgi:hypothetical protein
MRTRQHISAALELAIQNPGLNGTLVARPTPIGWINLPHTDLKEHAYPFAELAGDSHTVAGFVPQ